VVPPALSENGTGSELMLNTELLMDALETTEVDVPIFFTAMVLVILFPTGTVPNATDVGVEASEAARAVLAHDAKSMVAATKAKSDAKYRREGPPGWMLVKKVCWKTPQKRFWRAKNLVLNKFIPNTGYGLRSGRIY
jgi:hypothetical protein